MKHLVRFGIAIFCLALLPAGLPATASAALAAPSADQAAPTAKINVNTAGSAELQTIPGIGPALAARIIAYRKEHGPFESLEQLLAVKGIGPKLLTRMRDLVVVSVPAKDGA
jgi:comEA protein